MAQGSGIRPWKRGSEAARRASTAVIPDGDLVVTDEGRVYVGAGGKQASTIPPLARTDRISRQPVIYGYGDSTMAGTLTAGLSWLNVLGSLEPGFRMVNKGVGGNTTAQVLGRLQADIDSIPIPARAIVVDLSGTNDIANGVDTATTRANKQAMADLCLARNIEYVAATITPREQHGTTGAAPVRDLNNWLRMWAAFNGFRLIDFNAALTDPRDDTYAVNLNTDVTHPSAEGIRLMANEAGRVLTARSPLPTPSLIPRGCEVDYVPSMPGTTPYSSQLVVNPMFYATISDNLNYPSLPDYWSSPTVAAMASASSAGATSLQVSDPISPGTYRVSVGQVQVETVTITAVSGSSAAYTATLQSAAANPHPAAHMLMPADATVSLGTDQRFRGQTWKVAANNQAAALSQRFTLIAGTWSVGDKLRLIGKVAVDSPASVPAGKGAELQLYFVGPNSTAKAATAWATASPVSHAPTFQIDATIPANTTAVRVECNVDVGSGSATVQFGQIGCINLTTLGAAGLVLA